jgi:hypothetical protein
MKVVFFLLDALLSAWQWRDAIAPTTWSNWVLAFIGFLGTSAAGITLYYLYQQIKLLRDQTEATKVAAIAAKDSADALIASERAWIMTDLYWSADTKGLPNPTQLKVVESGNDSLTLDVCLICKNDGRTPAWILEKNIGCAIVETLPEKPNFDFDPFLSHFSLGPEPVTVGGETKLRATVECEGRLGSGKTLIVFGYVSYRDAFHPSRVSRFGYRIDVDNTLDRIPSIGNLWEFNSYS